MSRQHALFVGSCAAIAMGFAVLPWQFGVVFIVAGLASLIWMAYGSNDR